MRISDWSSDVCSSDLFVFTEYGKEKAGARKSFGDRIPIQLALDGSTPHQPYFILVEIGQRVMHRRSVVPHHEIAHLPSMAIGQQRVGRLAEEKLQDGVALVRMQPQLGRASCRERVGQNV